MSRRINETVETPIGEGIVQGGWELAGRGPGGIYPVIGELGSGDQAQVEEWGHGAGAGWARLSTLGHPGEIRWVNGDGLCVSDSGR